MGYRKIPISNQWSIAGNPAAGYVLKAYLAGTTDDISLYTDYTGTVPASSYTLNSNGITATSGGTEIYPHVDDTLGRIKLVLFNDADAANDYDVSEALFVFDNLDPGQTLDDVGINSQNVNYLPTWTNALTTNVRSALMRVVDSRLFCDGDGSTEVTAELNSMLTNGGFIHLRKGSTGSYIVSDSLTIASNTVLFIDPGTEIQVESAGSAANNTGKGLFDFSNTSNVVVMGNKSKITGVRTGTGTDNVNFGLKVVGCTDVVISDLNVENVAGDGWTVGEGNNQSTNIWLYRIATNSCMRNGSSLISGENVFVIDCKNTGTNGKSPQAGLDIETDGALGELKNINVVNMVNSDNRESDFAIVLGGNTTPSTEDPDIKLINCTSRDSRSYDETIALMIINNKPNYADNGNILIDGFTAQNVNNMGLFCRNLSSASSYVRIRNMSLIDTALTAASNIVDPGDSTVIGDSPINFDNNNATYTDPGNVRIDGLFIRDNTRDRTPFYINSRVGAAWTNVIIKDVDWVNSVGMTAVPFIQDGSDVVVEYVDGPYKWTRTSDTALTTRYNRFTFDNEGAVGAVVMTLPAITDAHETTKFKFQCKAAQQYRIDPNANDSIFPFGNGDGKYIETSAIGVEIEVEYYSEDGWIVRVNDESSLTAEP